MRTIIRRKMFEFGRWILLILILINKINIVILINIKKFVVSSRERKKLNTFRIRPFAAYYYAIFSIYWLIDKQVVNYTS